MSRFARKVPHERPIYRKLRGYAFDPSLSIKMDTAAINDVVYKVRWEELLLDDGKTPSVGPIGEYVEVVDFDPTIGANGTLYAPVDLNHSYVLANDGLAPSESNPQFHQQFVYAVSMLTIQHFEQALGRQILWAPRIFGKGSPESNSGRYEEYVPRLRIYPHAMRTANAYYSPPKKAVLCGYFSATPKTAALQMPGSLVFSCLSHDIVAHEVTHAILDGVHRNYNRATNPDVLAFHEAFSDIVALFQHFTFPEVLKHQIARTRGDLDKQSLLGELAQQVGVAIGGYGSLRDAIGGHDKQTGEWSLKEPTPTDYERTAEPHDRGSILVAAVFEAFLTIYKNRVKDLLRIATGGTGILPQGEIHPDLVNRLANDASKTATHVLSMCVRALDFCPPVDITFGEYLRAVITADYEMVKDDPLHYRLSFIDAFRRRGIYPSGIRTLSEESLRYRDEWDGLHNDTRMMMNIIREFLIEYRNEVIYTRDRREIYDITKKYIGGATRNADEDKIKGLHERLWHKFDNFTEFEMLTGLVFNGNWRDFGADESKTNPNWPSFQVLDLRIATRVGPDGNTVNHIIFGLVQRIGVLYGIRESDVAGEDGQRERKKEKFKRPYTSEDWEKAGHARHRGDSDEDLNADESPEPPGGIEVRGGCTLIFDLDSATLKYAIAKRLVAALPDSQERHLNWEWIDQVRRYQVEDLPRQMSLSLQAFGSADHGQIDEPFAMLHQHVGDYHAEE